MIRGCRRAGPHRHGFLVRARCRDSRTACPTSIGLPGCSPLRSGGLIVQPIIGGGGRETELAELVATHPRGGALRLATRRVSNRSGRSCGGAAAGRVEHQFVVLLLQLAYLGDFHCCGLCAAAARLPVRIIRLVSTTFTAFVNGLHGGSVRGHHLAQIADTAVLAVSRVDPLVGRILHGHVAHERSGKVADLGGNFHAHSGSQCRDVSRLSGCRSAGCSDADAVVEVGDLVVSLDTGRLCRSANTNT
jgi:hypothetical protein